MLHNLCGGGHVCYNMGSSFPVKIGVIMDVKRGLIQVINGIGLDIQVLPLNTINMINLVGNDVFEDKQSFMIMLCDEKGNELKQKLRRVMRVWKE